LVVAQLVYISGQVQPIWTYSAIQVRLPLSQRICQPDRSVVVVNDELNKLTNKVARLGIVAVEWHNLHTL